MIYVNCFFSNHNLFRFPLFLFVHNTETPPKSHKYTHNTKHPLNHTMYNTPPACRLDDDLLDVKNYYYYLLWLH